MTPDTQRRVIARQMGWKGINKYCGSWFGSRRRGRPGLVVPNYPTDLNAMAEVEATLTDDQLQIYYPTLLTVCSGSKSDNDGAYNEWQVWAPYRATAAQRAEAYLRTVKLWK